MIAITCRRCGSNQLQKNGHTSSHQQKYHCKQCDVFGTLDTKDAQRAEQRRVVERLHLERLSQRAIARVTGMSRSTIIKILKKSLQTDCGDHRAFSDAPDS